jgi:hypothetical protein
MIIDFVGRFIINHWIALLFLVICLLVAYGHGS